jgi:hypothetical protein
MLKCQIHPLRTIHNYQIYFPIYKMLNSNRVALLHILLYLTFRYGTTDAIFSLHSLKISKSLRKGKRLYCHLAFDSVCHLKLSYFM